MISLFLAAALSLGSSGAASATADPSLAFAQSLYDEGDYYRAIGEAKRFVFLHPGDARTSDAKLLVGKSYAAGGQWTAAAAALEPLARELREGPVAAESAFTLADVRMGAGDYDLAALEFGRFSEDFPSDPKSPVARLRVAWARMFAADVLSTVDAAKGRGAFLAAARELDSLPPGFTEAARAEKLAAGAKRIAAMRLKSPALAGVLSALIPGAGQLYAGRTKDAIIALLVNSLFIGGAVESYLRGNTVASGILVLFEMGWYTGNIYSAINSAHRTNDDRRASMLKSLKKDLYVGATPLRGNGLAPDGMVAVVGARF